MDKVRYQITHDALEGLHYVRLGYDWEYEFQLYDDDGILYFEGVATTTGGCIEAHDWAQNDSGCTYSKVRKIGETEYAPFIG
jgi:hypothetical protein